MRNRCQKYFQVHASSSESYLGAWRTAPR
jgi:hypothetical protein